MRDTHIMVLGCTTCPFMDNNLCCKANNDLEIDQKIVEVDDYRPKWCPLNDAQIKVELQHDDN